jgi:hypothetical protein
VVLYSFRAECIGDVCNYLGLVGGRVRIKECKIQQDSMFPDIEVSLDVDADILQLRGLARRIEDGHVIVDSIRVHRGKTVRLK